MTAPRRRRPTDPRWITAAAASALAIVVLASYPSAAQVGGERWTGEWTAPLDDGALFGGSTVPLGGTFEFDPTAGSPTGAVVIERVRVFLDPEPDGTVADSECVGVSDDQYYEPPTPPTTPPSTLPELEPSQVEFAFDFVPRCNGIYSASATAFAGNGQGDDLEQSDAIRLTDLEISIPPPPVASIAVAVNSDRSAAVTWQVPGPWTLPAGPPPDFFGYTVERRDGTGEFHAVSLASPVTTAFTDTTLPIAGGASVYRVRAMRAGAQGPSAPVYSSITSTPTATVTVPPPTTTTPPTTTRPPTLPPIGGGGPVPPGAPAAPTTSILPEPEDIPELGADDPVLPDDEFASGSVLQRFADDPASREGILIPIATALVLLGWSFHIRFIARAAREVE